MCDHVHMYVMCPIRLKDDWKINVYRRKLRVHLSFLPHQMHSLALSLTQFIDNVPNTFRMNTFLQNSLQTGIIQLNPKVLACIRLENLREEILPLYSERERKHLEKRKSSLIIAQSGAMKNAPRAFLFISLSSCFCFPKTPASVSLKIFSIS